MDLVYFFTLVSQDYGYYIVPHFLALITEFHLCGLCKKASAYYIKNFWLREWIHAISEHHSTGNIIVAMVFGTITAGTAMAIPLFSSYNYFFLYLEIVVGCWLCSSSDAALKRTLWVDSLPKTIARALLSRPYCIHFAFDVTGRYIYHLFEAEKIKGTLQYLLIVKLIHTFKFLMKNYLLLWLHSR